LEGHYFRRCITRRKNCQSCKNNIFLNPSVHLWLSQAPQVSVNSYITHVGHHAAFPNAKKGNGRRSGSALDLTPHHPLQIQCCRRADDEAGEYMTGSAALSALKQQQ
jgi:hypothetical protein